MGKKIKYKLPPLNCRLCKHILDDDDFIKEYKTPYVCGYNDEINPNFIGESCDSFKLGKWALIDYLKKELDGIKQQLIEIFKKLPGKKK